MVSNIFSVSVYCERVSAGWWQEPLNTWSNLLFLLAAATAAWVCHRRDNRTNWQSSWQNKVEDCLQARPALR